MRILLTFDAAIRIATKQSGKSIAEVSSMRAMCFGAAVIAMSLGAATVVCAQSNEPVCTPGVFTYMSYSPGLSFPAPGQEKPLAAYTVKFQLTFDHRLADGSIIHGVAHTQIARSSAGQTREERNSQCYRGEDGKPIQEKQITVFDPKEKTTLFWTENPRFGFGQEKKVMLNRMRISNPPPAPRKLTPEELAAMRKSQQLQQPAQSEFKHEDLGVRYIAGVEAHGTRTTRTIPPGEEGNDVQLVTVDEMWQSRELGLVVMGIRDDPRQGRQVQEAEEIDKIEPDASLFAPPKGYEIVEMKPQVEAPATLPEHQ